MWVFLIIALIAWVLSPFVLIPLLISMSSKVKKKDAEIRRLNERLSDTVRGGEPVRPVSVQLTIDDISGIAKSDPADEAAAGSAVTADRGNTEAGLPYETLQGEAEGDTALSDVPADERPVVQAEDLAEDTGSYLYESFPQDNAAEETHEEEKVHRTVRQTRRPRV